MIKKEIDGIFTYIEVEATGSNGAPVNLLTQIPVGSAGLLYNDKDISKFLTSLQPLDGSFEIRFKAFKNFLSETTGNSRLERNDNGKPKMSGVDLIAYDIKYGSDVIEHMLDLSFPEMSQEALFREETIDSIPPRAQS